MDLPQFIEHAALCGPQVEAVTLAKIAKQESALKPWALSVNYPLGTARKLGEPGGYARLAQQPKTKDQAVRWAARLVEQGHTVSFGVMQISSQNLARLGYTLEQAYEPCINIKIAAALLSEKLGRARQLAPHDPLPIALSLYNSGDPSLGFGNGYVSGVLGQSVPLALSGRIVPTHVQSDSVITSTAFAPHPNSASHVEKPQVLVFNSALAENDRAARVAPTRVAWPINVRISHP